MCNPRTNIGFTDAKIFGKYNQKLEIEVQNGAAVMLEFYESAQNSDVVACCRYEIENFSGNNFGSTLIEFNVHLLKGIFEIKTGTVQQVSNSIHKSHTFIYAGEGEGITFDYFFDQNVELRTFYAAFKINYVLLLVSSVLIIKVLFSSLWGVIKRFYMITLYYLAMPVIASTIALPTFSDFSRTSFQ
jgi:hypothetical protein